MKKKVFFALLVGLILLVSCGPATESTGTRTGSSYCGRPSTLQFQSVEGEDASIYSYEPASTYVLTPPQGCGLPTLYCVTVVRGVSCVEIGD